MGLRAFALAVQEEEEAKNGYHSSLCQKAAIGPARGNKKKRLYLRKKFRMATFAMKLYLLDHMKGRKEKHIDLVWDKAVYSIGSVFLHSVAFVSAGKFCYKKLLTTHCEKIFIN